MEYYDLVLGAIPGSILAVTGVLSLAGIGMQTAVPIGAVLATALIMHALFARAPSAPAEASANQSSAAAPSAD